MANVKMSFIGLLDMLRFKNIKVQRDKIIESTPALALVENYASNQNAAARHPLSQFFTIEDIQVRGKGDVKTFTLRRNDDQNPAFFRAGQFVVINRASGHPFLRTGNDAGRKNPGNRKESGAGRLFERLYS